MRLFIASRLHADNRRALSAASRDLARRAEGLLRPVAEGSEHLTHLFIGECREPIAALLAALAPVSRLESFPFAVGEAGVFPARGNPRLVCLQVVEAADRLRALSAAVHHHLAQRFPALAEQQPKHPHVTLARFRRGARRRDAARVEDLLASSGLGGWQGPDALRAVEVLESRLSPQGATYEGRGRIALAGSPLPHQEATEAE